MPLQVGPVNFGLLSTVPTGALGCRCRTAPIRPVEHWTSPDRGHDLSLSSGPRAVGRAARGMEWLAVQVVYEAAEYPAQSARRTLAGASRVGQPALGGHNVQP